MYVALLYTNVDPLSVPLSCEFWMILKTSSELFFCCVTFNLYLTFIADLVL